MPEVRGATRRCVRGANAAVVGAVFPRERWLLRVVLASGNLVRRLRGNAFRAYVHPVRAIDTAVKRQGLKLRSIRDTLVWRVAVYSR